MIFQQGALFEWMTVAKNIVCGVATSLGFGRLRRTGQDFDGYADLCRDGWGREAVMLPLSFSNLL